MRGQDSLDRVVDIFLIILVIVFIYLKITGIITLSWFWILCPIWGLFALGVILAIIIGIIFIVSIIIDNKKENKNERY